MGVTIYAIFTSADITSKHITLFHKQFLLFAQQKWNINTQKILTLETSRTYPTNM